MTKKYEKAQAQAQAQGLGLRVALKQEDVRKAIEMVQKAIEMVRGVVKLCESSKKNSAKVLTDASIHG